jgi:hypothetical protein
MALSIYKLTSYFVKSLFSTDRLCSSQRRNPRKALRLVWSVSYSGEERNYAPDNIYNMDETGFAAGGTKFTRTKVDSIQKSNWKVTAGRQKWITVMECIDGAGEALSPLIMFKAQNTNSRWIPDNTHSHWRFSTSTSGWTLNSHGYEWLRKVFENPRKNKGMHHDCLLWTDIQFTSLVSW